MQFVNSKQDRSLEGWVYILTNASMPGLVKIGLTGRNPLVKNAQRSKTVKVWSPSASKRPDSTPKALEASGGDAGVVIGVIAESVPHRTLVYLVRCGRSKRTLVVETELSIRSPHSQRENSNGCLGRLKPASCKHESAWVEP